jgi:hypothetical protein
VSALNLAVDMGRVTATESAKINNDPAVLSAAVGTFSSGLQ